MAQKLESFNYETSIGDNKTFNASFTVEINPDDQTKGLFISGVLGMEKVEDFILLEGTPYGEADSGWILFTARNRRFIGDKLNSTILNSV